jgi:hypothetical protein
MVEDRVAVTFDPKLSWPGARTLPATWDVMARIDLVGVTREVRVARLRVTADERLILSAQRSTHARRVLTEIRRYALAGLLVASRHMDDRLRRRLWRAAVRVVRRLDD